MCVRRLQVILEKEDLDDSETREKINLMLCILEPLVINEECAIKAIDSNVIQVLSDFLLMKGWKTRIETNEFVLKANLLLKMTFRSLVSCIRIEKAQVQFFNRF